MSYDKLRGRIREKYKTEAAFADHIGMNRTSLSLLLNGNREWKRKDMETVCIALGISLADMGEYFFAF